MFEKDCKPINGSNIDSKSTESEKESDFGSKSDSKPIAVKRKEPKNWDKIVKELEEEMKDENEDVDQLFKQLYGNADEDTRRAMNKSFVESKGTTLSMDWKSVSKKFVKPYDERDSDDDSDHSDHFDDLQSGRMQINERLGSVERRHGHHSHK